MTGGQYRNKPTIKDLNSKLVEALDDLQAQINSLAQQTTASAQGGTNAPPQISQLTVTAADGIFTVAITDNNPLFRGINYFVHYSESASFANPHVLDLGSSRNWRGMLGSGTLYFRACSSYPTSESSPFTYFGTQNSPTAVVGGGAISGPVFGASFGAGTDSGDGKSTGLGTGGFGKAQFRSTTGQAPKQGQFR